MFNMSRRFWKEERAQDLIEHTMLMAAIALVAAGLLLNVGGGVKGIWKAGDNQLTAANTASGDQAPAPSSPGNGGRGHGNGHDGGNHRHFGG
jgi:Flp pilus assembly pilin Flp